MDTRTPVPSGAADPDLVAGNRCLVNVMGQHFMVDLIGVTEETLLISFPGSDYPVEGMRIDLEFHDTHGFNRYQSQVIQGPQEADGGVLLERPDRAHRTRHRDACRVPTDLTVQVKDKAHVRRYDAALINLSAQGALIETAAPFDFTTTIEMTVSLPGEATHRIPGAIVHIGNTTRRRAFEDERRRVGVRFLDIDAETSQSLTRYIWKRLRDLYADV